MLNTVLGVSPKKCYDFVFEEWRRKGNTWGDASPLGGQIGYLPSD